jgi:hypothetical protein
MMPGMAPRIEPRTIITITAAYDRIIEDDELHNIADQLAAFLPGERGMITSGRDSAGPYTWQTICDDAQTVASWLDRARSALTAVLPGGPREILAVEVLTMEELMRRAKSRGFDPDAPARPLTDAERARAADIRAKIPKVVTTAAFARMLGCTPARVRQLRARAAAQIEAGGTPEDGFPQEIEPGSGYWLRADAQAYAALPRPTTGRPRTADRVPTTSYGTWVNWGDGEIDLETNVSQALQEFTSDLDVAALVTAYREAINERLPDGWTLAGSEFYGPHPMPEDAGETIQAAIEAAPFWTLAEQHAAAARPNEA